MTDLYVTLPRDSEDWKYTNPELFHEASHLGEFVEKKLEVNGLWLVTGISAAFDD